MPRILVADDHEEMRKTISEVVGLFIPDSEILHIKCGNELEQLLQLAVSKRRVKIADLVLTDNRMPPGPTGLELVKTYAGQPGCPPMILLYEGEKITGEEAVRLGAAHYIIKNTLLSSGSCIMQALERL